MVKPIIPIRDTLVQVKVPLPFPLRWVNAYVVRSKTGWTLIDPGLHTTEAETFWHEVMDQLNLPLSSLEKIVLTHHHPDHYGLSGWFQAASGAPVHISRIGREQTQALWGPGETMSAALLELFRRHGMEEALLTEMEAHMVGFIAQVSPQPKLTDIEPDVPFKLGETAYRPIVTPGHAAGHLIFYSEELSELFCGDHVLPQITPNVSYIPGFDEDPLRSYLDSLEQVAKLPVDTAFPGHRDPFRTFGARAVEIIRHHEERLSIMERKLITPQTSFQLCRYLFGERLSIHQLRFALSETIAHLLYLRNEGRIRENDQGGVIVYSSC